MSEYTQAQQLTAIFFDAMQDRKGFNYWLDGIDNEIQGEIWDDVLKRIQSHLDGKKFTQGDTIELFHTIRTTRECPVCEGSGWCEKCDGNGSVYTLTGESKCPDCDGVRECVHCDGSGSVNVETKESEEEDE